VSAFLELEIMPSPVYHKNTPEVSAFRTYFQNALLRIGDLDEIVRIARDEAERCGLSAMDALHVAAAHIGGAKVLVTLENESNRCIAHPWCASSISASSLPSHGLLLRRLLEK